MSTTQQQAPVLYPELNRTHVTFNLGHKLNERIATCATYAQALQTALLLFYDNDMAETSNAESNAIVDMLREFNLTHSWLLQYKAAL